MVLLKIKKLISVHAVFFTTAIFFAYVSVSGYFVWVLSRQTMETLALSSASSLINTLEVVRSTYAAEVVDKVLPHGINVTNDFAGREKTIPLPVNFTLEIARRLSIADMEVGNHKLYRNPVISIYSHYPFPGRRSRVLGDFQRDAIAFFEQNKSSLFYRFQTDDGRSVLHYAKPIVMRDACVRCHNSHPESPKRDWKTGDVRGVLEVDRSVELANGDSRIYLVEFLLLFGFTALVGATAVLKSVWSNQRNQRDLDENRQFLQKMMEVSSAVLSVFDFDLQKLVFVSPSVTKVTGHSPEEILGMGSFVESMVHPDDAAKVRTHLYAKNLSRVGEVSEVTYRIRTKNGDWIHVLTRSRPFQVDDRGNVKSRMSSTIDVSRILNLQQQLTRSNRELETFASVAAHDLRSPIAAIFSWIDLLGVAIPRPRSGEIEEGIGLIRINAQKSLDLINDILELSRLNASSVQIENVDLNQLVANVLAVLKNDIVGASAEVNVDLLPVVSGVPSHLEGIFTNLIRNALTYRSKERPLVVSVGFVDFSDHFQFFVRDNGIGIDPQFTDRIFGMFTRLHSADQYPGNGIGLAFCKKTVELAGGKIWVTSVPGEGSVFSFTWPHRLQPVG